MHATNLKRQYIKQNWRISLLTCPICDEMEVRPYMITRPMAQRGSPFAPNAGKELIGNGLNPPNGRSSLE